MFGLHMQSLQAVPSAMHAKEVPKPISNTNFCTMRDAHGARVLQSP